MNFLPFGYLWLIKKTLHQSDIKTVLDLGCGKGDFGILFNPKNQLKITGLEIYQPYLKACRQSGKYQKLISGDLTKKLKFKNQSFDAVICLQVIEHLKKKQGQKLLNEAQRVAKKIIIISTPVGECAQEAYDKNIHQQHHSAWFPREFKNAGFKVFGAGLKLVYGAHSHAVEKKFWRLPGYFISFLTNPLTNFFPEIAAQMVAVKKLKN